MTIRIECLAHAYEEIEKRFAACITPDLAGLLIGYDTDGCGCAVNGVVVVQWMNDRNEFPRSHAFVRADYLVHDQQKPPAVPVYYEPRIEWLLDAVLRLNYDPNTRHFQLRSDQQIFCI